MDDLTRKKFENLEHRIDAVEKKVEGVNAHLDQKVDGVESKIDALHDRMSQVETRVTTEIHAVLGAVADLKAWLVDRDDTKARLAKFEERLAALEKQRPS